jgi:uridine kinase
MPIVIRAIRRRQEGLPPSETIRAYSSLYFPAQLIHLALDDPRSIASAIIANDPRAAVGAEATYSA